MTMNYRNVFIFLLCSSMSLSLYPAQKTKKSVIEKAQEALDEATPTNEEGIVIDLKKNGINAKNEFKQTVLDIAAQHPELFSAELVADMIKSGADIYNIDNHTYSTPLHQAAFYGNFSMMEVLIQHGAKINALSAFQDTPLDNLLTGYQFYKKGELGLHSYTQKTYTSKHAKPKYYDAALLLLKSDACVS